MLRNGTAEDGKTVLDFYVLVHEQTDQLATYADESDMTAEQESRFPDMRQESQGFPVPLLRISGTCLHETGTTGPIKCL